MKRLWMLLFSLLACALYSIYGPNQLQAEPPILAELQYYDGAGQLGSLCQNGTVLLQTVHHSRFEAPSNEMDAKLLLGEPELSRPEGHYWQLTVFKPFEELPYPYLKLSFDDGGRLLRLEPLSSLPKSKN